MASKLTPQQHSILDRSAVRPFRITPDQIAEYRTRQARTSIGAAEVVLSRTSSKLVPSRVFAKEYEQAAELSALGNAVGHAIEWLNCPVAGHRPREIERRRP